jgi:V/A-type H+-transporting ATPase subunit B
VNELFTRYSCITSIVGDIVNLKVADQDTMSIPPRNRDLAFIEQDGVTFSLAQIIKLSDDNVSLQVCRVQKVYQMVHP